MVPPFLFENMVQSAPRQYAVLLTYICTKYRYTNVSFSLTIDTHYAPNPVEGGKLQTFSKVREPVKSIQCDIIPIVLQVSFLMMLCIYLKMSFKKMDHTSIILGKASKGRCSPRAL